MSPQENQIKCVFGTYKNNKFTDINGEEFFAISYHSVNQVIEGKTGFFNMRYKADIKAWIIFQYMLTKE